MTNPITVIRGTPLYYLHPLSLTGRAACNHFACAIQLGGEYFLIGQSHAVLRGQHLVGYPLECVACVRLVFLSADDQPDGQVLITARSVFSRVVEVKVQLKAVLYQLTVTKV